MNLITTGAAAKMLGTSRRQVQRWINSGRVPATPVLDEFGKVACYVLKREEVEWLVPREAPQSPSPPEP